MTIIAGSVVNLLSLWYNFSGGSLINLDTTPSVQVSNIGTGATVVAGTTVGVTHPGVGSYGYAWQTSSILGGADYLVTWSGTVSGAAVTATEVITLDPVGKSGGGDQPCQPWPVNWGNCKLTGVSAAVTGVAVQAATEILWALSGRRYGTCQLTVRPCRRECLGMPWGVFSDGLVLGSWWQYGTYPRPLFFNGVWYNLTCSNGCTDGGCSCSFVSETILPEPVVSVDTVKVDGVVLNTSQYRVDDFRKLVRLGGQQWPLCNDLTKDDTQVGTWSVTVTFGEAVPALGQLAVGELACRIARLLSGNDDCDLPNVVQQLVRQGVTMNFIDPNKMFVDGKIGLYLCDLFISTANPAGLHSRSEIFDIDGQSYRITNTS